MHELKIESTLYTLSYDELSSVRKELVDASKDALLLSHSPYSKFKVGCAIRLNDGSIVLGANQENASYPLCLCAEGSTLAAVATQFPTKIITEVSIFVPLENPASPCGLCRQSFKEYEMRMETKFHYLLASMSQIYTFTGIDTILPLAFCGEDLKG